MSRRALTTTAAIGLIVTAVTGLAMASPPMVSKAKEKGYPAKNCQYCHVSKVPKKDTFKTDDLNDRGKWMVDEKSTKKAKAINVEWLKDYPGGKEQK